MQSRRSWDEYEAEVGSCNRPSAASSSSNMSPCPEARSSPKTITPTTQPLSHPPCPPRLKRHSSDNAKSESLPLCCVSYLCIANPSATRIAEGQYYEAHQQLRVIASRYTKASDWTNATSLLYSGALSLLQAGQGGSGGDLCIFLIDVYNKGEVKVDAESKGRLLGLLRAFPKEEPTKKKFVGEMVAWSSRFGEFPAGDPEIHHVAGGLYAEGKFMHKWTYI